MKLDYVVKETAANPQYAVIWLHGLGADGHDFEPIVPELGWPQAPAIRYVFPHAPMQPVTLNGGMVMRAWYDILGLDLESRVDAAGISNSAAMVRTLIDDQVARGIASDRIILAGFSQGGAVARYLGLTLAEPLAGIVALSTYLPLAEQLETQRQPANQQTPIFWGHGTVDPMVGYNLGEISTQRLRQWGYPVVFKPYHVGHGVCPEEIADLRQWLMQRTDASHGVASKSGTE